MKHMGRVVKVAVFGTSIGLAFLANKAYQQNQQKMLKINNEKIDQSIKQQISQQETVPKAIIQQAIKQAVQQKQNTSQAQPVNEQKEIQIKSEQKKEQAKKDEKVERKKRVIYEKIADIPQFKVGKLVSPDDFIIIVADLPYNQNFQNQVISRLANSIKKRSGSKPLQVYKLKINDQKIKSKMQQFYQAEIKQQTILLLKNPYENKFINIDFDLFIQQASLPSIYLSQLKITKTSEQLKKQLSKMTPNDTYLFLAIDTENENEIGKKKITAKYIQMQMGVNNIENIKLYIVDEKIAKQTGLISNQGKGNSLHLIRKSNQFTYKQPNRWIENIPFNVVQNISLYDKSNYFMIPRYLSKIQTFNSMKIDAPYVCSITIDRNRINPKEQREILKVFSQLKRSQQFPQVSFVLKFGQTQFRGKQEDQFSNKKWVVKVANLDQLDKQLLVHDLKAQEDTKALGITQSNWLRNTFQYLYREPQITEEGLRNFISRTIKGQQPQFFKTEAKFKFANLPRVTGQNFNQKIFDNFSQSHLVFQYSDHCQTCQVISPVIDYFNDVCRKFPDLKINVHAINCEKNRVKGQPYSPYTPNLYYYSRNWQNKNPLKYPIVEYIGQNNIWGIYDFCVITDSLKKIDLEKFNEHIKNFLDSKVRLTDF